MYTQTQKAHSNHNGKYNKYEQGIIQGKYRNLTAIVADDMLSYDGINSLERDDDNWHVFNLFAKRQGYGGDLYLDSIAVIGAMNAEHATCIAERMLDSVKADYVSLVSNDDYQTWSLDSLNKLMSNPSQDKSYLPVVTAKQLQIESERITFKNVQWDGYKLISHNGNDGDLMLDMVKCDTNNDLVAPFDFSQALQDEQAEEVSYDSIMDTKQRLPLLKERLFSALAKASTDDVSVVNVTESKPFSRIAGKKVANIAFTFELSDGQTLSIWFHNPDSTPNKLLPKDIMISWKWLLNKRDVTGVLQPKHGEDVKIPILAQRMMKLAHKNSKRFKNAQKKRVLTEKAIAETEQALAEKNLLVEQLDKDIEQLQAMIEQAKAEKEKQAKMVINIANLDTKLELRSDENHLTQAVQRYIRENLQGKYINSQIGKVWFNKHSKRELSLGTKNNELRAKLIPFVPETIQNGLYLGREQLDEPKNKTKIIAVHKFEHTVNIDNLDVTHRVVVGERAEGDLIFMAYHSRSMDNKKDDVSFDSVSNNKVSRSNVSSSSVNNIANDENNVNQFDSISDGKDGWNIEIIKVTDKDGNEITELEDKPNETKNPTQNNFAKSTKFDDMEELHEFLFLEGDNSTTYYYKDNEMLAKLEKAEQIKFSEYHPILTSDKTHGYARALLTIYDLAKANNWNIQIDDFEYTKHNQALFDKLPKNTAYGITVQLSDGTNICRIDIDDLGKYIVYTGANGDNSLQKNQLSYKKPKRLKDEIIQALSFIKTDDSEKEQPKQTQSEPANPEPPKQSQEQQDIDYLNAIINDEVDMHSDVFDDKLIAIAERLGENHKLVVKAMDYYDEFISKNYNLSELA